MLKIHEVFFFFFGPFKIICDWLASFIKDLVAVSQFIDCFPTVVSDYAQAPDPAGLFEGIIISGTRKSE